MNVKREQMLSLPIGRLFIKYALPSVITMLFFGLQSLVDGYITGNYINAYALGGVNVINPLFSFLMVISLTIGMGCQTLVSHGLGEGNHDKARHAMTTGAITLSVVGLCASVVAWLWAEDVARLLGADDKLLPYALAYLRGFSPFILPISLCFYADLMLKALGHPLYSTTIMGCAVLLNVLLTVLYVVEWQMGTMGAAIATGTAFSVALLASGWFTLRGSLSILSGRFSSAILMRATYNGSSEGVTELSSGLSMLLINKVVVAMLYAEGVAAFTALNYINFLGVLVFIGISDGMIPVMGYHYGARQMERLFKIVRMSALTNFVIGLTVFGFLQAFGHLAIDIFLTDRHSVVYGLAQHGLYIFSYVFLINGFNILITSFFTSVGFAWGSMVIAALRSLVFLSIGMLTLPRWLGETGIWLSIPIAEVLTCLVAIILLVKTMRDLKNVQPN